MDLRTDILPHRDRLYRLALGITLHTAEAEDVVQDTMMRAWERRDEWPQVRNIGAWLAQICRNLALDRRKKAQPEMQGDAHSVADPHAALDARESIALLSRLMEQLPSPQDELVRLRDIEGLSYQEIAKELDITEDQVRVGLHRARAKLREQYVRIQRFGL